jgi:hypothetical protein
MEKGNYQIKNFYQGGYSSLDPSKSGGVYTGINVPFEKLSTPTDPNNANLVKEISSKMNLGLKNIEVGAVIPRVFEATPKQYLTEARRQAKLAGVEFSFHGPVVEPSGLTQQGYSESSRIAIEKQITDSLIRLHEANPKNPIINFHTSNLLPSSDFVKREGKFSEEGTFIVNVESGELGKIKARPRNFPGDEKKSDVDSEIQRRNEESWTHQIRNLSYYADMGINIAKDSLPTAKLAKFEEKSGIDLTSAEKNAISGLERGEVYIQDSYRGMKDLFDIASRNANPQQQEKLKKLKEEITKDVEKIEANPDNLHLKKEVIDKSLKVLLEFNPELYKRADEFMIDKTATTFGNSAFNAYKKFKEDAPILVIENPPATQQFSTGEDVAKVVLESRKKFVEAAKKEGMSESEAKKKAEKFIGATLDVGHLNMLRGRGFDEGEILKEAEKFKPLLKHVHLSDNFGFEHTELPMGMGNVPLKKIMEKLGEEGYEAKKIIEAGDWWTQHHTKGGGDPIGLSLEGLGSPMYSSGAGPYWNQTSALQQGYFGGYGGMLPQKNYEMFGAGFSQLPTELGGSVQGRGGRMSQNPME